MKQTIRVMDLQISGYTFRTEPAFINWEIVAGLEAHDVLFFDEQIHSALHCAIWAMSRHDPIDNAIRAPAVVRGVVKVRAKLLDDPIQMFDSAHESIREP
jgi:hypothetical protein